MTRLVQVTVAGDVTEAELLQELLSAAGIESQLEVATEHGSLRVPAVLYPPIRPEVIAMPYGQGHTAYGRYAKGRGANVALLNPFGLPGESIRANVTKVGGRSGLIRFGTELMEHMESKR